MFIIKYNLVIGVVQLFLSKCNHRLAVSSSISNRDLNQSETLLFESRIVDKVVLFYDLQRFLQKHIPLFHNILTHNTSTFNDSLLLTVIKIHIKMITNNYVYC